MTEFTRDDKGLFSKGDFVINNDPFHRYYKRRGEVIFLVGLRISEEDQSTYPNLMEGIYQFQQFKVQYPDRETALLTDSEWFTKC